ncbi:hypothetical protein I6N95_15570 [Vagococcus sp. BWB3-3]|uniref:Uncharacterized protein n=1 Tax=Vagococcus allomyrinae TaxID=2794353 RepID=A0A940PD86_9ENTE|nr:hypothetical protein [Vagococcus allomyrinae]MBP1042437.1 hypothetical protein [Vagococcus allomyrinae]
MTFLGLSLAELGAVVGLLSIVTGLLMKGFMAVKEQITRPLIQAMEKLQVEIKQLDRTLTAEQLVLRQELTTIREELARGDKQRSLSS